MQVKICGIRSYDDARAALDAGAWAIGFVFHRPSKRYIEPVEAASIVRRLPPDALTVGVFVDFELEALNEVVRSTKLRGAQLHGNESPDYAARVEAEVVIKALRVGEDFDPETSRRFPGCRILLDTLDSSQAGGTGKCFDWALARKVGAMTPIILAGGISPENAAQAASAARPAGLDVSSGVEKAPGVKDPGRIRLLFRALENLEG